jgi:4-hydroxy-tetrahydrodipicolinate synthase
MPSLATELYAACERGDLAVARGVWRTIRPICRLLEETSYMAAVKAACELVGVRVGPTRSPIGALRPEARAQLAGLLAAAGLVT